MLYRKYRLNIYIYICSGSLASFSSFSPGILVKHDSGIYFCCKESDKLQSCRHCLAPMQQMPGSKASLGCSTARLLIHQKSNPTKDGTTWYHHRPSRVYSFQHKLQGVRMTTLESHPTLKSAWVGRAGILKELRYSSTAHSNCMLKAVPWYMQWLTRFFFLILARNSCETWLWYLFLLQRVRQAAKLQTLPGSNAANAWLQSLTRL